MAVRKVDGVERLDALSMSTLRNTTEAIARETDRRIPQWARDNPVVRIVRVSIRRLDDNE